MLGSAPRVLRYSQDVPAVPVPTLRSLQPDYRPIYDPRPCAPRFRPCPEWYSIATRSRHVPPSIQHDLVVPNRARLPLVPQQSQQYLRAFDAIRQSQIDLHLQIKYPHHLPSLPHSIDAIFEAAQWILRAPVIQTTILTLPTPTPAIPIAPQATASLPSDSAFVKTAQFDVILSTIVQIITATAISKPDVVPTDIL